MKIYLKKRTYNKLNKGKNKNSNKKNINTFKSA